MKKPRFSGKRLLAVLLAAGLVISDIPAGVANAASQTQAAEETQTVEGSVEEQKETQPEEGTAEETIAETETDTAETGTTEEFSSEEEESSPVTEEQSGTESTEETEDTQTPEDEGTTETESAAETEEVTEEETETETGTVTEEETTEISDEEVLSAFLSMNDDGLKRWQEETGRVVGGYTDIDYQAGRLLEPVQAEDDSFLMADRAVTPSSYDAREAGLVSSVKNQAGWGVCWAFSAVTTAESAYKRLNGTEKDLSETQLVHFFYNDDIAGPDGGLEGDAVKSIGEPPTQRGGNSIFTTFAMARWTGIADEAADSSLVFPNDTSSNELSIPGQFAYTDAMHLENAYWISMQDADSVKKAIMEYGTVGISYYYDARLDSDPYKEIIDNTYAGPAVYYNPYIDSINHAVAIVGWDDSFDRNQFSYTYQNAYLIDQGYAPDLPEKNGAWLFKNSWGPGIGDGGYFWISYEDLSIKDGTAFAFDFGNADNYDHNYQYDGSAGAQAMGGGTTKTAAAAYTAKGMQEVAAVGVGFASASTSYTVNVYKDLTDPSNPESGTLAATATGKTSFEGFYTIELDDPVIVEEGERFSVVVTARNPGGAGIFVDTTYQNGDWIGFTAKVNKNETFYKSGSRWEDAAAYPYGAFTFRIKAYTNDFKVDITEADRVITRDMVSDVPDQIYNGASSEPLPLVVFDGQPLIKDTDFAVAYQDNDKTGTAKMVITGIGGYTGSAEITFNIVKKTLDAGMLSARDWNYDGAQHDTLVVKNGEQVMKEGEDYTVKYNKTPLNAGKYTATVTGKGNYSGTAKVQFTINKAALTEQNVSLAEAAVIYSGKAVKPAVTVKVGESVIPAANYSIKYEKNTNVGTAEITVTGKANCTGSVKKTFTITAKSVGSSDITAVVAKASFTGKALTPKVTVKDGKKTLKLNKDYALEYTNNINASSGTGVIITGMGNYQEQINVKFDIAPKKISAGSIKAEAKSDGRGNAGLVVKAGGALLGEADFSAVVKNSGTGKEVEPNAMQTGEKYEAVITLRNNYTGSATVKNILCKVDVSTLTVELQDKEAVYTYTGKAQKPKIVVKSGEDTVSSRNYTVSYADNTNAGTAGITVTGKGEYAGSKTIPFEIGKKNLDFSAAAIPDKTYTGAPIEPKITVKDGKKALKAGKDYTCEYTNNQDVSYDGEDESKTVTAGAAVIIKLSGNYEISDPARLTLPFKINPAKLTKVKANPAYYRGEDVAVTTGVTVTAGKIQVPAEEYMIGYSDNNKVNKRAVITAEAKPGGNFTGTVEGTFAISKEPLSKAEVTGIHDQEYIGKEVTFPCLMLKDQEGRSIAYSQYTVTYKNNLKAGTGSVTIKANKDAIYSGSITKKFKITKAGIEGAIKVLPLETKTYSGAKQTYTQEEFNNAVKSKMSGVTITCNKDYTVKYINNVNAGTAQAILTGKGNYTGTAVVEFKIYPQDLKNVEIVAGKTAGYNNGSPVFPTLTKIVFGKFKLVKGKDYTISGINTTKKGTALMKITGAGNYTGTRSVYYKIK